MSPLYMNDVFELAGQPNTTTRASLLRDHNGNKVTQLFCVIPAIAPYGKLFFKKSLFVILFVLHKIETDYFETITLQWLHISTTYM